MLPVPTQSHACPRLSAEGRSTQGAAGWRARHGSFPKGSHVQVGLVLVIVEVGNFAADGVGHTRTLQIMRSAGRWPWPACWRRAAGQVAYTQRTNSTAPPNSQNAAITIACFIVSALAPGRGGRGRAGGQQRVGLGPQQGAGREEQFRAGVHAWFPPSGTHPRCCRMHWPHRSARRQGAGAGGAAGGHSGRGEAGGHCSHASGTLIMSRELTAPIPAGQGGDKGSGLRKRLGGSCRGTGSWAASQHGATAGHHTTAGQANGALTVGHEQCQEDGAHEDPGELAACNDDFVGVGQRAAAGGTPGHTQAAVPSLSLCAAGCS